MLYQSPWQEEVATLVKTISPFSRISRYFASTMAASHTTQPTSPSTSWLRSRLPPTDSNSTSLVNILSAVLGQLLTGRRPVSTSDEGHRRDQEGKQKLKSHLLLWSRIIFQVLKLKTPLSSLTIKHYLIWLTDTDSNVISRGKKNNVTIASRR